MLARPGEPFDSDEHLFEIKWDGTRALAFMDGGAEKSYRLLNRRRVDLTDRYPELACLRGLPPGTVLDGEIVVLRPDGCSDFNALQSREQARTPARVAMLSRSTLATFIAFDQLYERFASIMPRTCAQRRELLRATVKTLATPRVIMSDGVTGPGNAYFEKAAAMGLEGVIAKRLDSQYLPGKRTNDWIKIKRQEVHCCVVIGFEPGETASGSEARDFSSLVIAAQIDGELVCVGKVGSGFNERQRARVNEYLWSNLRPKPVIPCKEKRVRWVEPGLYCTVRCMERTATGQMRGPALVALVDPPHAAAAGEESS
jgi:ATP-dependent DNA ligase